MLLGKIVKVQTASSSVKSTFQCGWTCFSVVVVVVVFFHKSELPTSKSLWCDVPDAGSAL